ncbi:EamA family transporter [Curtobacterium sp. SORGH_AS_0776]|uniref:EamA family transporter n=1 Tax=Curtobacterium sp. SORGH_AS_0776 TaxID=3041798 RepID=UPI002857129E|nr:EamA family transporter [Curtobacterium sp. SORGH_AS_0776]MDR6170850.1 DME family drug/metabolite transporter [Curtobacterium sp. SORGH_AS_0776]
MTGGADASRASRPVGGLAAVLVAAAVWGTTGTATHFAPGVPAFVFGAVTFGLGGIVLALGAGRGTLRAVADPASRRCALLGAASLVVYAVAFYAALADAGVALGTTVAIGSSPVFAGVVEWVADGRRVTRRWVVATLVSVVGMVVVTLARSSAHAGAGAGASDGADRDGSLVLGLGSALLAGLTYALYSWAVARGMRAVSVPVALPGGVSVADRASLLARAALPARASLPGERGLVGAVFGLAAVPLVVLAVVGGQASLGVAANWPVFLYLALVPTVLGHSLYAVGLRSVSASVATLLSLFEPVVAAVLAVLVVGEHLGAGGWVGIGLVVVGLAVLAVPERTRA